MVVVREVYNFFKGVKNNCNANIKSKGVLKSFLPSFILLWIIVFLHRTHTIFPSFFPSFFFSFSLFISIHRLESSIINCHFNLNYPVAIFMFQTSFLIVMTTMISLISLVVAYQPNVYHEEPAYDQNIHTKTFQTNGKQYSSYDQ
ncbi:hypothetical protein BDF14DRAFT_1784000 [Spinellus fusiger]|nr:hypothetical protein BDF14DRAFT_1784000 [Spinellus fusiger]